MLKIKDTLYMNTKYIKCVYVSVVGSDYNIVIRTSDGTDQIYDSYKSMLEATENLERVVRMIDQ